MHLMVVAFSLKRRNKPRQRRLTFNQTRREVAPVGDLFLFVGRRSPVDLKSRPRANIAVQACAPVAQRIEHLPCMEP